MWLVKTCVPTCASSSPHGSTTGLAEMVRQNPPYGNTAWPGTEIGTVGLPNLGRVSPQLSMVVHAGRQENRADALIS
jgi:hypothetical protein